MDGPVDRGGELDSVGPVENDLLHAVGVRRIRHPVQNHVAHGDLPKQRFPAALRRDNAGQPVQVLVGLGLLKGLFLGADLGGGLLGHPGHLSPLRLGQHPQGEKDIFSFPELGPVPQLGVALKGHIGGVLHQPGAVSGQNRVAHMYGNRGLGGGGGGQAPG